MSRVPVLIVSGYFSAGKSALVTQLVQQNHGLKPAVLINQARHSVYAGGNGHLALWPADTIELNGGCVCCTARDQFIRALCRLVENGHDDYVVAETMGLSEPLALAELFALPQESWRSLSESATLRSLVTVVDARQFLDALYTAKTLRKLGVALNGADQRYLVDLLVDQVENANVLVVNKADAADHGRLRWLIELLHALNPRAVIVPTRGSQVPADDLLHTQRFDPAEWAHMPGWLQALGGAPAAPTAGYGIETWVYAARRPFHPQRLWQVLQRWPWRGVLRSKGFVWLASRPYLAGLWNHAGRVFHLDVAGEWWASMPLEERPIASDPVMATWDPVDGDQRQEIAFIGQQMKTPRIQAALDSCLLTDAEMAQGPAAWLTLVDPLPAWDLKASLAHLRDVAERPGLLPA